MAIAEAVESWQFTPGTEIDRGRTVVRLLGGGERYEAWLGWDDHLLTLVVIKMLRPNQLNSTRARSAIEREARALSSLAHPGIVRLFDSRVDGERPYLMLEFLDGPRLSTLLRRFGPLAPEQLVALATELCSTVGYLHHEGLLHLDVKPQNIIMGAPPRLIDLSIARGQDEVAQLTGRLGTDAYMAPEQCTEDGLRAMGPWTDVWGIGVTLYESANGYRPFKATGDTGLYPQLTQRPAPFHDRVPGALTEIISGCLAQAPADRLPLAEVADRIESVMPDARDVALRRLRRRVR